VGGEKQAAVEKPQEMTRNYETALGTYAFGFVLVLLLIMAFAHALSEKDPDGIPTTPRNTTPIQPSPLRSPVAPQPQATSPGASQRTTTAP
jgi:hypothetical protein